MVAGRYNERIEILKAHSEKTAVGSTTIEWLPEVTTRANVVYNNGNRTIAEGEVFWPISKTFIVRSYVPVTEQDRILFQDKQYRILSVDKRRDYNDIEIHSELVNE